MALCDIAHDFRGTNDAPVRVVQGRKGDGHVDAFPPLSQALRLQRLDALTGLNAGEDGLLFVKALGWDQRLDRLANHLGRRVAKDPFASRVPAAHDALHVFGQDRIERRCDQRPELVQLTIVINFRSNVTRDFGGADNAARSISDRGHGDGHRNGTPAFVQSHGFERVHALAARDLLQDQGLFPQALCRKQAQHRLAQHLLGRIAKNPRGCGVPAGDHAVQCLAQDGIVGRFDDRREQGFGHDRWQIGGGRKRSNVWLCHAFQSRNSGGKQRGAFPAWHCQRREMPSFAKSVTLG